MIAIAYALLIAGQTPAASATPQPPVAEEKKICRREVATGSIMPGKKVCMLKSEWAAIDEANARNVAAMRARGGGRSSGINGQ